MAVCCQWSAKSCPDKEKVFCECVRDFHGISIIGRVRHSILFSLNGLLKNAFDRNFKLNNEF